jgi:predicted peptidase
MNALSRSRRLFVLLTILVSIPRAAVAQRIETGFLDRVLMVDGEPRRFQVYVPRGYSPLERWPVILALHGSGDRGTDGLLQTTQGIAAAIRRNVARWPAIVVFPQMKPEAVWNGEEAELAMQALDQTMKEFVIDPDRVYLTGFSRGGSGAWFLAYRYPERLRPPW